jgi:group I intron endonuclease
MKSISGIYMLKNLADGKVYIGATKDDIIKRVRNHFYNLIAGTHKNTYLQSSWDNGDCLALVILEECSNVDEREEYWIEHHDSLNREKGYNIEKGGKLKGKTRSSETREKQSISLKKSIAEAKATWK